MKNGKSIGGEIFDEPEYDAGLITQYESGDFEIENGVLMAYNGKGDTVRIPAGVSKISADVFLYNRNLKFLELGAVAEVPRTEGAYGYLAHDESEADERGSISENNAECVIFGSYPQSLVEDSTLVEVLNKLAGNAPGRSMAGNWISYKYFIGDGKEGSARNKKDFMWYQDVEHEGERYRGVYFIEYRPGSSAGVSEAKYSRQYDNGYRVGHIYWFLFEPIKWRIVKEHGSDARIIADLVLDAQPYQSCYKEGYITDSRGVIRGKNSIYANSYEHSSMRAWLNKNFLNTAFDAGEIEYISRESVDNSVSTTGAKSNKYASADTVDYVTLLSYSEAKALSAEGRIADASDYAKCQGTKSDENAIWWLRSPDSNKCNFAKNVSGTGGFDSTDVDCARNGVRPVIWVKL